MSSGVCGSDPSKAFRRASSMRIGTFQRYRISANSPKSGTKGANVRISHHGILLTLRFPDRGRSSISV